MTLTIPNLGEGGALQDQAAPDSRDFEAIVAGFARTGVVSGCAVAQRAAGANMSVDVAAGLVSVAGTPAAVAGGNLAVGAADPTNPRFDLVVVNAAGAASVVVGTPAASTPTNSPHFPSIPAASVVLAAVYVPALAASVTTVLITDKRVVVAGLGLAWRGAWTASTQYAANDLVTNNGGVYLAPISFVSGLTFNAANWTVLVSPTGTYVPLKRPNTVVMIGTSLTANNRQTTGVANAYDGTVYNSTRGPWTWAAALLGQRLEVLNWAGITGQTSTQIAARVQTDMVAYAPGWVVMDLFTNDIKAVGSSGGVAAAVATMQANAETMFQACDSIGARCLLIGPPPITGAASYQKEAMYQIIRWCKQRALRRGNVLFLDAHDLLADSTTTDSWRDPAVVHWTTDGTHWGPWGAALVGTAIADLLDPLVAYVDVLATGDASGLTVTALDANLIANGLMTGSGGTLANGAAGVVPANWKLESYDGGALAGSVVGSVSDRSIDTVGYGAGSWWQVNVTGAASKIRAYNENDFATGNWAPGDVVAAQMEVDFPFADLSTVTQLHLVCGAFRRSDFKNALCYDLAWSETTCDWPPPGVFSGRMLTLRTPPLTIPDVGGNGAIFMTVDANMLGTGRFGRASFVKSPSWGTV